MAKLNLRPLDDRVVVQPKRSRRNDGWRHRAARFGQGKAAAWPTVVAVGPGKLLDSGNRGEMSVTNGDTVIYGRYGGSDVEVDGQEMKILRESDILAKVL